MTRSTIQELSLTKRLNTISTNRFKISGISSELFGLLFSENVFFSKFLPKEESRIIIFNNENEASQFFYCYKDSIEDLVYFPNLERDLYSSIIQNDQDFDQRISIISRLARGERLEIVTTYSAASLKLPPKKFFEGSGLILETDEIYDIQELATQLVGLGFKRSFSIEEPGSFSIKGEIFDLHPTDGNPVRINFFDTIIETINEVDPDTLITKKNSSLKKIVLSKTSNSFFSEENILYFKNKYPRATLNEKELFEQRKRIFESLNDGYSFENFQLYTDYFFDTTSSLFDWVNTTPIVLNRSETIKDFELYLEAQRESRDEYLQFNSSFVPEPEEVFDASVKLESFLDISEHDNSFDDEEIETLPIKVKNFSQLDYNSSELKDKIKRKIKEINSLKKEGFNIFIATENDSKLKEINDYFDFFNEDTTLRLPTINYSLNESYIYFSERLAIISDNEFFTDKKSSSQKRSKKNLNTDYDLFAEQLATLVNGDYVIHKVHGIGKYLGVETLTLGGSTSDYLVIEYKDNDKVYVPVYKLDLVQKYATSTTKATLADLKKNKFEQAKSKARESVKKLAFSLIELQAKRKMQKGFAFSEPEQEYNDFSFSFPYSETIDQEKAINAVIDDMTSDKPMDRLVCGDVGFGKTEVAMRAAFKAVIDGKQVAMLVPTTILAFQHFNSFKQRYKNFPVNIESISRLRSTKEVRDIQQRLEDGKIDILIGTHKILSDSFKFKDLGLLIIDEEQRFGVGHKEKMRLLKENVDTLTMTATPIPRTLQLSFLGIKELSLIKTPPPRRQSIKTFVIKEDQNTLRTAIEKELSRNGQIYIVHNKVSDIEIFTGKIRELAPKARIVYAHGQLPERELEKRIAAFYKHEYDILISTTIIESGIDIPNANTMIIDRADTFGLSQLHQLRGRIGRSNRRAYAYFVIPKFKKLSDVSAKRLKALQTFAELGSGFSISSSDLEIRGAGDVLGPEQSGHINNIGLELYMELLNDAINELKGTPEKLVEHVDVHTNFNAYIPEDYITSSSARLRYYKQLAGVTDIEQLESQVEAIIDQFGKLPEEFLSLVLIMKSKTILRKLGIEYVKVQTKSIVLKFSQILIDNDGQLRDKIISFFTQRPKIYKINPDYSINCAFKDKITINDYYDFIKHLKDQLE